MDKDLEKIRGNLNKENLRLFLDEVEKEAKTRNSECFTPDFIKGIIYTLGIVRNFFKLWPAKAGTPENTEGRQ